MATVYFIGTSSVVVIAEEAVYCLIDFVVHVACRISKFSG